MCSDRNAPTGWEKALSTHARPVGIGSHYKKRLVVSFDVSQARLPDIDEIHRIKMKHAFLLETSLGDISATSFATSLDFQKLPPIIHI